MKRPGFLEGVAFALTASLAGAACHAALGLLVPGGTALRLVIAGLALAYILYLLGRSRERVGRVTSLALWSLAALTVWLWGPPLSLYLLWHLGGIWLVRSLYFHTGPLAALADLGLVLLGLAAAVWALTSSGSLWLSLWCFFLVQALFTAMPARLGRAPTPARDADDPFQRAHNAAESALRTLYNR